MVFPTHIVAAGAMVTNEKGEVLLVKNPRRGWEFPGGQVENGEDLIQAVIREVKEEAGVDIKVISLAGVYSNTKSYLGWDNKTFVPTKVIFDFIAEYIDGELKTSEESIEVGWFEKDQVMDLITEPYIKDRMNDMLEYKGKITYRVYASRPYEVFKECTL